MRSISDDSLILPEIARRHFLRWAMSNKFRNNPNPDINIFDEIKVHGISYTISFLNHQLWDKLVCNIKSKKKIGPKSLSITDLMLYFNRDELVISKFLYKFKIQKLTQETLDSIILRLDDVNKLKQLYCILYTTKRRNRRKLLNRRCVSMCSPELKPIHPIIEPLPIAIAKPVNKTNVNKIVNSKNSVHIEEKQEEKKQEEKVKNEKVDKKKPKFNILVRIICFLLKIKH